MSDMAEGSRKWWTRITNAWIRLVLAHRWWVLLAAAVASCFSVVAAARLSIDGDLRALLADEHPVIVELREVERALDGFVPLIVLVKSPEPAVRHRFMEQAVNVLEGHPDLHRVEYTSDPDFFREHALYYLDDQAFEAFVEHLEAWVHFRFCSVNPDICIVEPDAAAAERLEDFVEQQRTLVLERLGGFNGYYEAAGVDASVMLLYPRRPYSDVDAAEEVTTQIRQQLEEIGHVHPKLKDVEINLVGEYAVLPAERHILRHDIVRSVLVGALGIAAILFFALRSLRAVIALLITVGIGVVWSLGLGQLLLGRLNVATSLISTVILGLGIDAGIHFLGQIRRHGHALPPSEAITQAFSDIASPLLLATGTTLAAFAVLLWSSFAAFRELGLIAIIGVSCCQLSMVLVLPALLVVLGIDALPPAARSTWAHAWVGLIARHPRGACVVVLVVTGAASLCTAALRNDGFEYDGRNLRSDEVSRLVEEDTQTVTSIFGHDVRASILLAGSAEELVSTWDRARVAHKANQDAGSSVVARLVAVPSMMPPLEVDLERRQRRLDELLDDHQVDPSEHDDLGSMLRAREPTWEQLPPEVLDRMRTADGRYLIAAYPTFRPPDIQQGLQFFEETAAYAPDGRMYVGEVTIYVAMYQLMSSEWPYLLVASLCLAIGVISIHARSVGEAILLMLPVPLGLLWTLAILWLLGGKLTLFNVPILATLVGIGIDGSTYVAASRRAESHQRALVDGIARVIPAVVLASLTTMVGFSALMTASSGAMRSIGYLAVLGTACCTLVVLVGAPACWSLLSFRRERAIDHQGA